MHTDIPAIETPKRAVHRSGRCETTDIETQSYIYRLQSKVLCLQIACYTQAGAYSNYWTGIENGQWLRKDWDALESCQYPFIELKEESLASLDVVKQQHVTVMIQPWLQHPSIG